MTMTTPASLTSDLTTSADDGDYVIIIMGIAAAAALVLLITVVVWRIRRAPKANAPKTNAPKRDAQSSSNSIELSSVTVADIDAKRSDDPVSFELPAIASSGEGTGEEGGSTPPTVPAVQGTDATTPATKNSAALQRARLANTGGASDEDARRDPESRSYLMTAPSEQSGGN